jgi:hypothetical protein
MKLLSDDDARKAAAAAIIRRIGHALDVCGAQGTYLFSHRSHKAEFISPSRCGTLILWE